MSNEVPSVEASIGTFSLSCGMLSPVKFVHMKKQEFAWVEQRNKTTGHTSQGRLIDNGRPTQKHTVAGNNVISGRLASHRNNFAGHEVLGTDHDPNSTAIHLEYS